MRKCTPFRKAKPAGNFLCQGVEFPEFLCYASGKLIQVGGLRKGVRFCKLYVPVNLLKLYHKSSKISRIRRGNFSGPALQKRTAYYGLAAHAVREETFP